MYNEKDKIEFENNWFVEEPTVQYSNRILEKSFNFSVRIVKLYKFLIKKDFSLSALYKQLLRSGTSIGANISEAQSSPSKKDFINKLNISLKEAQESKFWLNLLKESDILTNDEHTSLYQDNIEIIKILIRIIKTSKENL